jgi:uncharacterized protein (TIGR02594 family)
MSTDLQSFSAAAWLVPALNELGQCEGPGNTANPRIVGYYARAGHAEVRHDETAWCAAFVGAMLETAGYACSRSLLARSYLNWGFALTVGRPGAVAVFRRGTDAAAGHVAFWLGETGGRVQVLGGNQGDAVSITTMLKTDLLGLRWPSGAAPPADAQPGPAPGGFDAALAHVVAMEGGWSDDPLDPGGPTNFGVTLQTFAAHRRIDVTAQTIAGLKADLRAISQLEVRDIYRTRYWQPCRAEALPRPLALMHFDAAVNHGVSGAARLMQQALGVTADSAIGPVTLAAVATQPLAAVLQRYATQRRARYRSLGHFWRFGRGWLARVDATLAAALRQNTSPPPHSTEDKSLPSTTLGARPMIDIATSPSTPDTATPAKWWGHSVTIWGTLITALTTVLPLLGPALGLDIKPEFVRQLGDNLVVLVQAITGLIGTILALYGRSVAVTRLERRSVTLQL